MVEAVRALLVTDAQLLQAGDLREADVDVLVGQAVGLAEVDGGLVLHVVVDLSAEPDTGATELPRVERIGVGVTVLEDIDALVRVGEVPEVEVDPAEHLDRDVGTAGRGHLLVALLQLGDSSLEVFEGDLGLGRGGVLGAGHPKGQERGDAYQEEPTVRDADRRPVAREGDV